MQQFPFSSRSVRFLSLDSPYWFSPASPLSLPPSLPSLSLSLFALPDSLSSSFVLSGPSQQQEMSLFSLPPPTSKLCVNTALFVSGCQRQTLSLCSQVCVNRLLQFLTALLVRLVTLCLWWTQYSAGKGYVVKVNEEVKWEYILVSWNHCRGKEFPLKRHMNATFHKPAAVWMRIRIYGVWPPSSRDPVCYAMSMFPKFVLMNRTWNHALHSWIQLFTVQDRDLQ